jgi:hypothetical protein
MNQLAVNPKILLLTAKKAIKVKKAGILPEN